MRLQLMRSNEPFNPSLCQSTTIVVKNTLQTKKIFLRPTKLIYHKNLKFKCNYFSFHLLMYHVHYQKKQRRDRD